MKKIIAIACILLLAVLYAGCTTSTNVSPTASPSGMRAITDLNNRTVEIPQNVSKVAVFTSPLVQDMYIIGAQDRLCAITTATQKSSLLQKIDPRIKNMSAPRSTVGNINTEELMRADPDICIGSIVDMEAVEKTTKIPTLEVSTNDASFKTVKDELSYFGKLFGNEQKAEKYNQYLDDRLALLQSRTSNLSDDQKPVVYFGFNPDHLTTYGGDTFMQERIGAAGCKNAAGSVTTLGGSEGGLMAMSLEQILSWDPDIIVIDNGKPEDLYNSTEWAQIKAVKNKRVYVLPSGMFLWNRPSAESAVLIPEWLAITAYPDRFNDMTARNEIREFYTEIFEYNLSEQDLNNILNPPAFGSGPGTGSGSGPGNGKQ
jgi:iron complex transport system substrate-binding protein